MLYLDRRPGEAVVIQLPDGRLVRILFDRVIGGVRAKLCFEADRDIVIDRYEIHRMKQEGQQCSQK